MSVPVTALATMVKCMVRETNKKLVTYVKKFLTCPPPAGRILAPAFTRLKLSKVVQSAGMKTNK